MKIKLNKFQFIFLGMFIFFNTYALFYLLEYKETFGDYFLSAENVNYIFLAYFITILPFLFFGYFLYPYFETKFTNNKLNSYKVEKYLSIFVLILQLSFLIFNILTGTGVAGSTAKTNSMIKYIFILFSPDIFFYILYGFARDNKLFKYNLIIYLVSNLLRGWMGCLFFVSVMELYILYKRYGISKKLLFFIFSLISILLALLPYIVALKWAMRRVAATISIGSILNLNGVDYSKSLFDSINYLFGRFQELSNIYLFLENLNIFQVARNHGEFVSSFSVGLPQMLIYKIFGWNYTNLPTYFVYVMNPNFDISNISTNVQVGYAGLLLSEPYLCCLFFFYSILLVLFASYFSNKIGGKYMNFVSWYSLVVFLLHGWLGAYIGYILGLISFYIVKRLFQKMKFL